jgi:alpha-beta hydrolase superfamily lysophospholipase
MLIKDVDILRVTSITGKQQMPYFETPSGRINSIEFPAKSGNDTILCIHGFCTDARIFSYMGTMLSEKGYNVVSIDLPGHGKSGGPRGDLDFDVCLRSIDQIVRELKKKSRVFIMAHSLGSTYALWYAHTFKNTLDGLIILCPYIRIGSIRHRSDADPAFTQFLSLLLHRVFTPRKTVNVAKAFPRYVEISGDQFARMMNDPGVTLEYSYRYLIDIFAMRNSKVSQLSDVSVPVLLLHGKKDRNVFAQVSEEFFKLIRADQKEIRIFDCDHWFFDAVSYNQSPEKYSEESRRKVISSIARWLDSIDGRN